MRTFVEEIDDAIDAKLSSIGSKVSRRAKSINENTYMTDAKRKEALAANELEWQKYDKDRDMANAIRKILGTYEPHHDFRARQAAAIEEDRRLHPHAFEGAS